MENNNRQGCRWVSPSERLPQEEGDYVCRLKEWKGVKEVRKVEWYEGQSYKEFWENDVEEWLDESIEPCATSSENYWKQRCEAAERFINESPCDPDITKSQIYAHGIWQQLKNNPTDKEGG